MHYGICANCLLYQIQRFNTSTSMHDHQNGTGKNVYFPGKRSHFPPFLMHVFQSEFHSKNKNFPLRSFPNPTFLPGKALHSGQRETWFPLLNSLGRTLIYLSFQTKYRKNFQSEHVHVPCIRRRLRFRDRKSTGQGKQVEDSYWKETTFQWECPCKW